MTTQDAPPLPDAARDQLARWLYSMQEDWDPLDPFDRLTDESQERWRKDADRHAARVAQLIGDGAYVALARERDSWRELHAVDVQERDESRAELERIRDGVWVLVHSEELHARMLGTPAEVSTDRLRALLSGEENTDA